MKIRFLFSCFSPRKHNHGYLKECSAMEKEEKNIAMPINYSTPNFNANKCWPIDLHVSLAKWKSHVNPLCLEKVYFIKPF